MIPSKHLKQQHLRTGLGGFIKHPKRPPHENIPKDPRVSYQRGVRVTASSHCHPFFGYCFHLPRERIAPVDTASLLATELNSALGPFTFQYGFAQLLAVSQVSTTSHSQYVTSFPFSSTNDPYQIVSCSDPLSIASDSTGEQSYNLHLASQPSQGCAYNDGIVFDLSQDPLAFLQGEGFSTVYIPNIEPRNEPMQSVLPQFTQMVNSMLDTFSSRLKHCC